MREIVYLNNNSHESLDKIKASGIETCICCTFEEKSWIHCSIDHVQSVGVHGTYHCEMCDEKQEIDKCIICLIKDELEMPNTKVTIFNDVDAFIAHIKHCVSKKDS